MKSVVKILSSISASEGKRPSEVFDDFAEVCACALAFQTREAEYLAVVGRYRKPESVQLFPEAFALLVAGMDAEPFKDQLGPIYMDLSPNTASGEFYTPRDISRLMARMTIGAQPLPDERPIRVLEPTIGAGVMVLAAAEHFLELGVPPSELFVEGWDVSRTAIHMSYVNTTLFGIPAKLVVGNSLSGERRAVWRNIHFPVYRSAETTEPTEEPEAVVPNPAMATAAQLALEF